VKLLADEGVDRQMVQLLREAGHDLRYIAELHPGISDENVLEMANDEERKLLTTDKDFGELVYRQKLLSNGVILARLSGLTPDSKAKILLEAIEDHAEDLSPKTFAVVTPGTMRIRKPD
jgi:predicted nuclease of predicted toxin-antitoxin system